MAKLPSINFQQVPKAPELMSLFRARPGHKLVDSDINSVEPRIVAFFSRDATLLELYATGKPHDVYLYVALHIFPEIAADLRAVYQPDNPTEESRDAAKSKFAKYRKIAKEFHLACGYGASAWKVWQTLNLRGIAITLEECERLHALYWKLFAGVQRWGRMLQREAAERGGWILNGRGRPLAVIPDREKDVANMFAQSTGHDCLLSLVWHVERLRQERGLTNRMWPWIVDFHDETIWECAEADVPAVTAVIQDAYTALNNELGADIPLIGGIDVGDTLWDLKKD